MSISVNLDDEQSTRLEDASRELGVDARELAKAAVNDLLTRPTEDFDRAAQFVLRNVSEITSRFQIHSSPKREREDPLYVARKGMSKGPSRWRFGLLSGTYFRRVPKQRPRPLPARR